MSQRPRTPLQVAIAPLIVAAAALLLYAAIYGDEQTGRRMLPHGYCFTWQPSLLAVHVASDTLIGLAYMAIPLTLLRLARRRSDIPFNWMFLLFATFITSCGLTHWMEVWTIWNPDYWASGAIKAITAAASVPTAIVLATLLPRIVAIPTTRQLQQALSALESEVAARIRTEEALRAERALLDQRVAERTAQLSLARASAEEALHAAEAADKSKDQFLASVSHELRTPLQAIQSWAQFLGIQEDLSNEARRAVERLLANVAIQGRLINDLLDLSRILSGKLSVAKAPVELAAVVTRSVETVQAAAAARGVEVVVQALAESQLETDAERLQQVMSNLLTNAINASRNGGRILVRARVDDGLAHVEVEDAGVGFDPEEAPVLFLPFRQGRWRGQGAAGLGLGLAISRNIMSLLGGTLALASEGRGRGATATLTHPLGDWANRSGAPSARIALTQQMRDRLRGARLLFVEDDAELAEPQAALLSSLGTEVVLARSAGEALRAFAPGRFDLLVSDLQLGDGPTGHDLMREIARAEPGLPALAVSAYGTNDDLAASKAAGFRDHLTKPVDVFALATAIVELLPPR